MVENWQYKLKAGSELALNKVFNEYYTLLSSIAYQYVGDKQVSEGIAEDVIVYLWEKREQLLPLEDFRRYILRMVRNRSIDYLRKVKYPIANLEHPNAQCFISDSDIFEDLIREELLKIIDDTLNGLSTQCRTVFELSRNEGLTYHEIAIKLGISENMVKYYMKSALKMFRMALGQYLVWLASFITVQNSF
jgi:RNA polymerase sigma-70 factor (ECF subfamily)